MGKLTKGQEKPAHTFLLKPTTGCINGEKRPVGDTRLYRVSFMGGYCNDCGISAKRASIVIPEEKYAESITHVVNGMVVKGYPGNCPFLRHNRKVYLKEKKEKEDALREKEETKG